MLVSHENEFIYTKTGKTAGTSIEVFFEPFCLPDGESAISGSRDTYKGKKGIVGHRGGHMGKEWYGHMPARDIRKKVGEKIWDEYFKFTIVRNPYDIVLSLYRDYKQVFGSGKWNNLGTLRKVRKMLWDAQTLGTTRAKYEFRQWVKSEIKLEEMTLGKYTSFVSNRNKYMIDGEICVDYFILYEDMHRGVAELLDILNINDYDASIPEIKTGKNKREINYCDLYDEETRKTVKNRYEYELSMFDYSYPC